MGARQFHVRIETEAAVRPLADDAFSPSYLRNATAYGHSPALRIDPGSDEQTRIVFENTNDFEELAVNPYGFADGVFVRE